MGSAARRSHQRREPAYPGRVVLARRRRLSCVRRALSALASAGDGSGRPRAHSSTSPGVVGAQQAAVVPARPQLTRRRSLTKPGPRTWTIRTRRRRRVPLKVRSSRRRHGETEPGTGTGARGRHPFQTLGPLQPRRRQLSCTRHQDRCLDPAGSGAYRFPSTRTLPRHRRRVLGTQSRRPTRRSAARADSRSRGDVRPRNTGPRRSCSRRSRPAPTDHPEYGRASGAPTGLRRGPGGLERTARWRTRSLQWDPLRPSRTRTRRLTRRARNAPHG
jgi:hypothetical protein